MWYNRKMIVLEFLLWYFVKVPQKILGAWRNFLKFNIEFFSIPLLLKTLFAHWRKYKWAYPRGFDLGVYLEVWFSNLISRTLGAIVRLFLIFIGILAEIIIFFAGAIVFLGWLALPSLLLILLLLGIEVCLI